MKATAPAHLLLASRSTSVDQSGITSSVPKRGHVRKKQPQLSPVDLGTEASLVGPHTSMMAGQGRERGLTWRRSAPFRSWSDASQVEDARNRSGSALRVVAGTSP
jgi:hypothetical protein